jgi:deazaflavin-dependent oxidoreductase (nitroreductase family)
MNWQKLYNPVVIWLLHSPLHSLMDKSTILITFTGRKSGKKYTVPVSYMRDGDMLLMISQREHSWWKNLRGGAQVTLYMQGHASKARGEVFTDAETVANKLLLLLQQFPRYQRLIHIKLVANGQPENPEAFQRFVQEMVIVQMKELVEVAA